ncbi:Uncharacterized protein TCM_003772 [Theobroma cacao]|uniref:Uncharacterized protein n=1 Tax=Theobroma cacao TaxID=3641 RepID=A0A061DNI2_THECC|nr:Uncharacterized protein TCM_003772 [Theobroma cacao]
MYEVDRCSSYIFDVSLHITLAGTRNETWLSIKGLIYTIGYGNQSEGITLEILWSITCKKVR